MTTVPIETQVRQRVKDVYAAAFAAEITAETLPLPADDKLGRSAGKDGVAEVAVYPESAYESPGRVLELIVPVILQLYPAYTPEPDEHIVIDPSIVEAYGQRLRDAFAPDSIDPDFWFCRLTRIDYPDDPTGNRSRLEARIEGHGDNSAVLAA